MENQLQPTWATRELPILRVALRRLDAGEFFVNLEEIRSEVALEVNQMRAGLNALTEASPPYIRVTYTMAGPDRVGGHLDAVSERARRELGTWPSPDSIVDVLSQALNDAASAETHDERKSRLRAAADTLASMARDVAVGAIASQLGRI
ncbi:MAG: hypothetical protein QOI20_630 [Acidimicrobiaceae bacterium]|nr:hypothetical protein [Acidimicrobiaceae bacterium]